MLRKRSYFVVATRGLECHLYITKETILVTGPAWSTALIGKGRKTREWRQFPAARRNKPGHVLRDTKGGDMRQLQFFSCGTARFCENFDAKYCMEFIWFEFVRQVTPQADVLKAGVHMKPIFIPLNFGLMRISSSHFKHSQNPLLIPQSYV